MNCEKLCLFGFKKNTGHTERRPGSARFINDDWASVFFALKNHFAKDGYKPRDLSADCPIDHFRERSLTSTHLAIHRTYHLLQHLL